MKVIREQTVLNVMSISQKKKIKQIVISKKKNQTLNGETEAGTTLCLHSLKLENCVTVRGTSDRMRQVQECLRSSAETVLTQKADF